MFLNSGDVTWTNNTVKIYATLMTDFKLKNIQTVKLRF